MAFYTPIKFIISSIPTILFIDEGVEQVISQDTISLTGHIKRLYKKNLFNAQYRIIFLRKDTDSIMSDIWSFDKVGERGSGPLCDVTCFRDFTLEESIGIGSGNTLLVLGSEEKRRRKSGSLAAYLQGSPNIDDTLLLGKNFL